MRVVLSAIAGLLRFEVRVFVPAVAVSSAAWAVMFLWLGEHFGKQLRPLMHLPPAHLIPWVVFGLIALSAVGYVLRQRLFEGGRWAFEQLGRNDRSN
jgi:membrane protein DedA with SNARE-associated domain